MRCSICRRAPTTPVVSAKSGHIFERRLVEAYIDEHGRCPVTGEPLSKEDLIVVRGAAPDAAVTASGSLGAASIPSLLERFQAEWEGVALEQFSLRQQVTQMQLELAHALQQYDAACRVIARLSKEIDVLRGGDGNANGEEVRNDGTEAAAAVVVPPAVLRRMDAAEAVERQSRKKRKASTAPDTAAPLVFEEKAQWSTAMSRTPVSAAGKVAVSTTADNAHVYASAPTTDHAIVQYSRHDFSEEARGLGHTAAVHTLVSLASGLVVSAAEDQTVRVWSSKEKAEALTVMHTLRYANGVTSMSQRTVGGGYLLCGAANGVLTLSDLESGTHVVTTTPLIRSAASSTLTCVELHPYASLAAVALEPTQLQLWDSREMRPDTVITLPRGPGAAAPIGSLTFNSDCISLAAGLEDGSVYVWDLRHVSAPVAVLAPDTESISATVRYAPDGHTLAVGGPGVSLYHCPRFSSSVEAAAKVGRTSAAVCDLSWSTDGVELLCGSVDGTVRLYASVAEE